MSVYNPLAGLLRTFDTYFVGSFTTREHAAVIVFTFLLGGLISLVQKSGIAEGGWVVSVPLGSILPVTHLRQHTHLTCMPYCAEVSYMWEPLFL